MSRIVRRHFGARTLLPALLAAATAAGVLGLAPGGPAVSSAADPFVAGQRSTLREPVTGSRATAVAARAAAHRAAIGGGRPASIAVEHVRDRFAGTAFDEVIDRDERGRPLALQRLGTTGRLLAAVRFGGHNPGRAALGDAGRAEAAARRHARALGIDPVGAASVRRGATDEWIVEWPRAVDGVAVPGDGVVVRTWVDGTLHTVVNHERELAERPARVIAAGDARTVARARLAGLLDPRHAGAWRIDGASLAWVAPNDAFDAAAPDAPDAVLRLAWVVRVTTSGDLAASVRGVELYLDAGDGRLLGGDVLR